LFYLNPKKGLAAADGKTYGLSASNSRQRFRNFLIIVTPITTNRSQMTNATLDSIDKQILTVLQQDSRISFADLSRQLNIPEATIRFRVKRLQDNKIITRFAALVDPTKVGFAVSGAILLKIDPAHLEEACKTLTAFSETIYLFQCTGEYDIVSVIFAHDMAHLNDVVKRTKMIAGVKDARLSVTTRFWKVDSTVKF
jgi:Lrp/AsnC family transcriptional regulator for asnA, asnC and gidA